MAPRRPQSRRWQAAVRFGSLLLGLSAAVFGSLHFWLRPSPEPERRPGPIGITVMDLERRPLPAAVVELFADDDDPVAVLPPACEARVAVDDAGRASPRIDGRKHLVATAPGLGSVPGFLEMGDLAQELVLGPPAEFTGTVVDVEGRPVAGARVEAFYGSRSGPTLAMAETDAAGCFTVTGLSSTLPYVNFRVAAMGHALAEVEALAGKTTRVRLNPVEPVQGSILDAERRPIAGALVVVSGLRSLWCRSDAEGRFRLDHVPARAREGQRLRVLKDDLTHPPCKRVQPGDQLTIILLPGHQVEGQVLQRVHHRPVADLLVYHECGPRAPIQATTDGDGRFRLDDVPTGELVLHLVPSAAPERAQVRRATIPAGGLPGRLQLEID